jgi:hypothetical protein
MCDRSFRLELDGRIAVASRARSHCWGCGAPPPPSGEAQFLGCDLCLEKKYAVCCRFCSRACYKASWKRHTAWHAEKDAWIEGVTDTMPPATRQAVAEAEVAAKGAG